MPLQTMKIKPGFCCYSCVER